MMNTRKKDDPACNVSKGFDCYLTGKKIDVISKSAKSARQLQKDSNKYLWTKI